MYKIGGYERHCDKNERRTVKSEINITHGTELLRHGKWRRQSEVGRLSLLVRTWNTRVGTL